MGAAPRAGGWRRTALPSLACLAVAAAASTAAEPEPAGAAARPELQLVSVSVDRTVHPGRTVSAKPSCRRGFAFLSSRFHPIAVDPAGARPDLKTLAIVPHPKGATLTFRNAGAAAVRIRATADCARIAGRPSLRTTVVSRAVKLGARASTARASARRALSPVCGRPNSVPGDVGFAARRGDLARLAYFRAKRGRVGVRGVFAAGGREKAKLFLSCLHGRGLRLAGQVAGGGQRAKRSAVGGPRATSSGDEPLIVIRFGTNPTKLFHNLPFPSLDLAVSKRPRQLWGNPLPAANTGGAPLAGRGFVTAEGSTSARPRWTPFYMRYGIDRKTFEDSLAGSEIVRITPFAVKDTRIPGKFGDFEGGGGGTGGGGTGGGGTGLPTSKTVGPLSVGEACVLGFFIDVYIPSFAQDPTHQILENDPPCPSATITTEIFEAGVEPPDTPPGETRWRNDKTYRIKIKGARGDERPFSVKVSWTNPVLTF
jgi:hypothetical protein